jgi:hypothetical protein
MSTGEFYRGVPGSQVAAANTMKIEKGGRIRSVIARGLCLMTAGVGLFAVSLNSFGGDLTTAPSQSVPGPSQLTRADHRPPTAQPSASPDSKLDYLAAHVRMVDRLYEELMQWRSPCSPASADASMAGKC